MTKNNQDDRTFIQKEYKKPELKIYGNIAKVTENVGMNAAMDSGSGTGNMTH